MTMVKEFQDKFATVNEMKFHYLDWGAGGKPKMLLLHGGAQTAHSWDEFSRAVRKDYHVIALDQRGHGDSAWARDGVYTRGEHLKDITGFTKAVGLDRFLLIGLSMGGMNSIVYTAAHPDQVERLVIVDVGPEINKKGTDNIRQFVSGPDVLDNLEAFVERAHTFNPRRSLENLRERLRWNLRQLPNGKWTWKYDQAFRDTKRGFDAGDRATLWEDVKRITCPTLIVRGGESDVLTPEAAERLHKAIPGSKLVVVPKAGHTVNGDNPEGFLKAVREFLKG